MKTELSMVVMAGVVLSVFLVVAEIAALRKRAKRVQARLKSLYATGAFPRLALELCAIAALLLAQPLLIGLLVALAMDGINPAFSGAVIAQLRALL